MGQQSLEKLSQGSYLETFENEMLWQADLLYLEEHFKLETQYNKHKMAHAALIVDTLNDCGCELSNWVFQKINGDLEDTVYNRKIKKLESLKFAPVQVINNIFNYSNDLWEQVEW